MKKTDLIKKLIFELCFTGQQEKFLLPETTKENFYNQILPVIEKVFAAVPDNITIRLEQLEIDAGKVNMDELKSFLEKALHRAVQEEMSKQKNSFSKKIAVKKNTDFSQNSSAESPDGIFNLFIYFLKTGLLPWYQNQAIQSDINDLIRSVISPPGKKFKNLLTYQNALNRFKNDFETVLLTETGRERLINSFQHTDIISLLGTLKSGIDKRSISATLQLLNIIKKRDRGYTFYRALMNLLILSFINNEEFTIPGNTGNGIQLNELLKRKEFVTLLQEYLTHTASNAELAAIKALFATEKIRNTESIFQKNTEITIGVPTIKKLSIITNNSGFTNEMETAAEEGITVNNAGLILLSPFLAFFFTDMGLIKDGIFKDDNSAVKAAQLLHYVVYESSKTPEYLLPLNKLLCGINMSIPVPASFTVTKKLKNERRSLLENVIERWGALGNTSVAGFVNTFIQRNGILYKKENDWLLKIEPLSFDILLDKLPWNINFIKLKWNDYTLHTEWDNT